MYRSNQIFAICDTEKEYAFRFMEYISRKQNLMFDIRAFTTVPRLVAFAKEHPVEILLISERSMCEEVALLPVNRIVILQEGEQNPACSDFMCVYKYQSSDAVVREIMSGYSVGSGAAGRATGAGKAIQIYGVFAPAPYPEQMYFSLALGMKLAREKRTLYLNLEAFSGLERFAGFDGERSLGDLLYLFRQSGQGTVDRAEEFVRQIEGLDCLPPVRTPSDFMEVTGEEWIRFCESLAVGMGYEALVLDVGTCIPDAMLLLSYCSKVFLPASRDLLSDARIRAFRELLQQTENEALLARMEVLHPPAAKIREDEGAAQLGFGGLGRYVQAVCAGEEARAQ